MATFIEDLGIVSAYGEAVRKGYTGTEEEFAEMLANLPDKLAEAREYAASAAESSASAASSADGVQRNASIASTAASDAQSAAASALQSATFAETTAEGIEEHEEQCRIYRAEAVAAAEELKTTTLWNDALIDETVTGKIASFSDGCAGIPMKSIVAEITSVQDLNGYSNPWPGGGGKNKIPYPTVDKTVLGITYKANEDGSIRVTGTATSEVSQGIGDLFTLPAGTYIYSSGVTESFSTYDSYVSIPGTGTIARGNSNAPGPQFTLTETSQLSINIRVRSGQTVNITFKPMIRLASISDDTYEPYSNICPISGRTGMTVTRSGNILSDVTWVDNSVINAQGVISTNNGLRYSSLVPVVIGESYAFLYDNIAGTNYNTRIHGYDSTGAWVQQIVVSSTGNNTGRFRADFTIPSGISYIRVSTGMESGIHAIALGVSANYPITWESSVGTVYGGTLDVISGVLTVDRALVDLGNMSWGWSSNGYFFSSTIQNLIEPPKTPSEKTTAICSMYKAETTNDIRDNIVDNAFGVVQVNSGVNTGRVWIRDTSKGTDAAEFKTEVTGQTLVYPLATPQTYQLTPTEVQTLLGENLVYSDADDVTVNYYVDMKGYIDKRLNTTRMMIAGVETSFVATKNYAIGDFVIVNDTLYRITAVITSGETITPGTNASETTVAEQLIALYNA